MVRSNKITVLALFAVAVLVMAYVFSLRAQLHEQQALASSYKEKVNALSGVTRNEAKKVNDLFIERFFNYQNTIERYKDIQALMTRRGFKAAHPSGENIPEKGTDILASTRNVQSYEHVQDRTHVEYISTFTNTIRFNGVSSSDPEMIKTKLIFVEGEGWKIDDLENIPIGRQVEAAN
jgi:hypothetical protein